MTLSNYFILLFCIFVFQRNDLVSQELNIGVKVIGNAANLTDRKTFEQLENMVKEFLNDQRWTNDKYEPHERIRANLQISIKQDKGNNELVCDLTIQSFRPVFKSSYETMLVQFTEKDVPILFDPFRPMENNREVFTDNLSAVMTFYAYMILALDYDSYSLEGGEPYLNILQNMLINLPSNAKSYDPSWTSNTGKKNSRFFLFENLNNPRMKPFRRAFYEYHRLGLDQSSVDMNLVRRDLVSALKAIAQTDQTYPNTFLMQSFINAKRPEIIEIFKQGTGIEKQEVHNAMTSIDPSNASSYDQIKS
ncbi:MAG: DUF4835 family protein [Saprospiraceae bacterium]|nr:DUF4835 family protein [Saprospiraceae bacterium]